MTMNDGAPPNSDAELSVASMRSFPMSVQRVLSDLVSSKPIDALVLFGSRAMGDNDIRSDFDIAVSAPSLQRREFSMIRVEVAEAPTLYWISLVHLELTPLRLRERILRQGVLIYERPKASG
jgi:uncharacterized protein